MPGASSYDRYGLTGNPFRDLASENIDDVELFHVNLQLDDGLRTIKDEVLEKENKALVALVGNHGAGKTERLLLAATEARTRGAFVVYFDITDKTPWILRGLAQEFQKSAKLSGFGKIFSPPTWYRELGKLLKTPEKGYDPIAAGKIIGKALNANAPALLLLNDLHHITSSSDAQGFARTLQEIADVIRPGVLVMFGCYPNFMISLTQNRPPLASRINRTVLLPAITNDEAALLIAKKLLAKRLVENLDPVYPFEREAINQINGVAFGNPRRLLEVADRALEYAIAHRAYRIDTEVVHHAVTSRTAPAAYDEGPGPTSAPPDVMTAVDAEPTGPTVTAGLPAASTARQG